MSAETKEKRPGFSAYILLSEPVQFNTSEIEAALLEDYPSLDLGKPVFGMDQDCDTAEFITTPLFFGANGPDAAGVATLIRLPGYGTWDPNAVAASDYALCPDLPDRLRRNASYICVSVSAKSDELLDCFRAARLCTALAAVFAKLPVALAVYWDTACHFVSPEEMIKAADTAISDDWPYSAWLNFRVSQGMDKGQPVNWSVGVVTGLEPFKGFEISAPVAPVSTAEMAKMLFGTAALTLGYGNTYRDGDTVGTEEDPNFKWRLRFVPKGVENNAMELMLLIHPEAKYDADERLGQTKSVPPPPGYDNKQTGKEGFFKRLIRGRADS